MAKRILIIEDDRFIGEMYVRSLRSAGYEVDWMVDGDTGLAAARTTPAYDLLLLDVMLPQKSGVDILQALRNEREDLIPNTKVLVLTNFDQDEESRHAMEHNADGYLIKAEITPNKLLEIINEIESGTA